METPTVFVVPPHPALMCPIHDGILDDPVTAPCGCTFCSRCIEEKLAGLDVCPVNKTHTSPLTKDLLFANDDIAGRVNELLIHCRYGVRKDPEEGWVPCSSPDSCKMWINLGNRTEHESKCPHKPCEDEFCFIEEDDLLEFKPDSDSDELLEVHHSRSRSRSRSVSPISSPEPRSHSSYSRSCSPVPRSSRSRSRSRTRSMSPRSETMSPPLSPFTPLSRSPSRSPPPPPPESLAPIHLCPNGCDFACVEHEELEAHAGLCDRTLMQRQIDELTVKLISKDEELSLVRRQLTETRTALLELQMQNSPANTDVSNDPNNNNKKVIAAPPDFYITLAKGLNKLEEESQRALEEAAATLKKTKAVIKESAGSVLNNIKKSFEEVHDEFVIKFNKIMKSLDRDRPASPAPAEPQQVPEDVELQQVIAASEASFKEESVIRAGEDELLNQALRISLMDIQHKDEDTTDSDSDASSTSGENDLL